MRELPLADRALTEPHPDRLPLDVPRRAEILAAHRAALAAGEAGYLDPVSGLFVLTASFLAERGTCCERGCRHCPYVDDARPAFVRLDEDILPAIEGWFDDPEVQRRLGGRAWLRQALEASGSPGGELFRGMRVLQSFAWVAVVDGDSVGYVGGDVYDRWATAYGTEAGPAAGLAYLVDPARRGHGLGRSLLRAALERPELADVPIVGLGIDVDNVPSRRCADAAGFPVETEPDAEGIVYHVHRR